MQREELCLELGYTSICVVPDPFTEGAHHLWMEGGNPVLVLYEGVIAGVLSTGLEYIPDGEYQLIHFNKIGYWGPVNIVTFRVGEVPGLDGDS